MAMVLSILRINLFVFLLLSSTKTCWTTSDQTPIKIPVTRLREDFRILRTTLEEAHPGLYWYTAQPAMNRYFDSTYRLLSHDMTDVEFFKVVLPLIARIRCVHTILSFSEKTRGKSFTLRKVLPLKLYYRQGKAYIREDFNDAVAYEGLEILAINYRPIRQLTTRFLTLLPADGYNDTHKYYLLEHGAFGEAYALFIGQPDQFVIDAVDAGSGKPLQFSLPAKSQQELNNFVESKRKTLPVPEIDFSINPETAILTITTFEVSTEKFSDRIRQLFKTIHQKNVTRLIIDLRNNGGGNNGNVAELFAYLSERPFRHLKKAEMSTRHFTHLNYVTNPSEVQNLRGTATGTGTYTVNYLYSGTALKKPVDTLRFRGNVVILVNGGTVSAASEFVALAHSGKRAIIVGEETGGCYYGATGGRYLNLVLPNSQLKAHIPIIRIFTDVTVEFSRQPKGRGILPDYAIRPTIREVLASKDSQMERALWLVNTK